MNRLLMSDPNKPKNDGHSFRSYKEQYGRMDDPRYLQNLFPDMFGSRHRNTRAQDYGESLARSFDLRTGGIDDPEDFNRHLVMTNELSRMTSPHGPAGAQLRDLDNIQREAIKRAREKRQAEQLAHAAKTGQSLFGAPKKK
jgi:hypothetical protein